MRTWQQAIEYAHKLWHTKPRLMTKAEERTVREQLRRHALRIWDGNPPGGSFARRLVEYGNDLAQ